MRFHCLLCSLFKTGVVRRMVVVIGLMMLTAVPGAQANLISNGGFEGGFENFYGWYASELGSTIYLINSPHSGDYAVVMGRQGTLSQTFQTTPGSEYSLKFWLYNSGQLPNSFQTLVNGTSVYERTQMPWQPYTENIVTFIADSTLSTLAFNESHGWSGNFYLDDVSVAPIVPEPATLVLLGAGIVGFIGTRKRHRLFSALS